MAQTLRFTTDRAFRRLDLFLTEQCDDLSRSEVQRLISDGHVTVDGAAATSSTKLIRGRQVSVTIPDPVESDLVPERLPLNIVYEDADILVVDKAAGMTVHPAPGHPSHTLANAVLALCPDLRGIGGTLRPGIVHRLDKNTSGLMVVAKSQQAHTRLSSQLKARRFEKVYLALVHGSLSPDAAAIEAPIGRNPRNRKRMAVVADGRPALTRYSVLERPKSYSLVEVQAGDRPYSPDPSAHGRCRPRRGRGRAVRQGRAGAGPALPPRPGTGLQTPINRRAGCVSGGPAARPAGLSRPSPQVSGRSS